MSETLSMNRGAERLDDEQERTGEHDAAFYRVLGEAGVTNLVEPFGTNRELAVEHPRPHEMPDADAYQTTALVSYEKGMPIDN